MTNLKELGALLLAAVLALLLTQAAFGQELVVQPSPSEPAVTLAKYLASLQDRNPFTEAGPVRVEIDATLPGLSKQACLIAVRETGDDERSSYRVESVAGDSTVKNQVIARYIQAQREAEALPYSSVAVTPANYKFRYVGSIESSRGSAYVFQITPRKKRIGMIKGQIWLDPATGVAVRETGKFVKRPSIFIRQVDVVRDVHMDGGVASERVTHLAINTRIVGLAELTVTERPIEVGTLTSSAE